jgi:hypothetical protein
LVPPPPPAGASPKPALGYQRPGGAAEGGPKPIPIRNLAPPPPPKKSLLKKLAGIGATLVILGVGAYFGWTQFGAKYFQDRKDAKPADTAAAKPAENAGAGPMGEVNGAMDVSDALDGGSSGARPKRSRAAAAPTAAPGNASAPAPSGLVVPAKYTLDLSKAKIPESRVNGIISGTNFLADTVRIEPSGATQVLRLFQGQGASPDSEMLVYLHLNPMMTPTGHTWTVSQDLRGPDVPQVAKRWKTDPKFAPKMTSFANSYAMKLELGDMTDGAISGKIFLALPDPEESVIAGTFKAALVLAQPGAAPVPVARPAMAPTQPAGRTPYDSRYGPPAGNRPADNRYGPPRRP